MSTEGNIVQIGFFLNIVPNDPLQFEFFQTINYCTKQDIFSSPHTKDEVRFIPSILEFDETNSHEVHKVTIMGANDGIRDGNCLVSIGLEAQSTDNILTNTHIPQRFKVLSILKTFYE